MIKFAFYFFLIMHLHLSASTAIDLHRYFIPEDHPAKPALDLLFKDKRPLLCYLALKSAGFSVNHKRKSSSIYCAKHPKLKGYLIKTFLDDQCMISEEEVHWVRRIVGARQLKQWIENHQYENFFKVPEKWIYALPNRNSTPPHAHLVPKKYILVVEDMQILKERENRAAYVEKMTEQLLNALYFALTENLLIDSIYIDNIPFCKDGRVAFIDTEHYNVTHLPLVLEKLSGRLSPAMARHWQALIPNFHQPVGSP